MQERRAHNEQMASDIGYIRGVVESLAGPEGRITKLEKAAERQWWVTYVVTPAIIAVGHAARAFGVKI